MRTFDVIVIGAGSGLLISNYAAEKGLKTAVIDEGPFGGTCLNRGCIPTKMLIESADVAETVNKAGVFGVRAKLEGIDWNIVQKRVWNTVDPEAKEIEASNRTTRNITVYKKRAVFESAKVLRVGNEMISGKKIFICAGARPIIPQIPGIDKVPVHTSDTILRLKKQPKKLVIIGGGYIGAELAHFFSGIGTQVTIVDRGDMLLKNEDTEIAKAFTRIAAEKYTVLLNTRTKEFKKTGNNILVTLQNKKELKLTTDAVLIATGRRPNTYILQCEKAGIQLTEKGFVKVNKYLETNVRNIWAIGDIAGIYMFKHSANLEANYAIQNAFGRRIPVDYSAMPHAVFTSPQIAGVGCTEEELKQKKITYLVGRYKYIDTGMGKAIEDKTGFVKVLADKKTRKIIGCHIIGTDASTLIHEVVVAMRNGLTADALARTIHVHPALPEVVQRACAEIE